jgi:hypothetical protein
VAAAIKSDIFENMRGALKYVEKREKEGNKLVDAPTHWLFFFFNLYTDTHTHIPSAASVAATYIKKQNEWLF